MVLNNNLITNRKIIPQTIGNFYAELYWVYADHRVSFYCGCTYSPDRKVDLASCGLETLADKPRAQRIEAEHIFPAAQFGNFRPCWRDPRSFPTCLKADGSALAGVHPTFAEVTRNQLRLALKRYIYRFVYRKALAHWRAT
jgi:endonuclease I